MYDVEADLSILTADFGKPVTFAGSPEGLLGIYRRGDASFLGDEDRRGDVLGLVESVLLPTSVVAGLALEAAITVDGRDYTVRDRLPYGAGVWTRLLLRTAEEA